MSSKFDGNTFQLRNFVISDDTRITNQPYQLIALDETFLWIWLLIGFKLTNNTLPRLYLRPKTGMELPKRGFLVYRGN